MSKCQNIPGKYWFKCWMLKYFWASVAGISWVLEDRQETVNIYLVTRHLSHCGGVGMSSVPVLLVWLISSCWCCGGLGMGSCCHQQVPARERMEIKISWSSTLARITCDYCEHLAIVSYCEDGIHQYLISLWIKIDQIVPTLDMLQTQLNNIQMITATTFPRTWCVSYVTGKSHINCVNI